MRTCTAVDGAAVVDLVVAAGMFDREGAGFLAEGVLEPGAGGTCIVEDADDGRGLASVVFYRPEDAADRAFDLTMIAVRPDLQGVDGVPVSCAEPRTNCAPGASAC